MLEQQHMSLHKADRAEQGVTLNWIKKIQLINKFQNKIQQ